MKAFDAETRIAAGPSEIWSILTDAQGYPSWNPTVRAVEGSIRRGERIVIRAAINPGRAFPVRVTEFDPGHRMVWVGGLPLGLFSGRRTFTLEHLPSGEVDVRMRETYSGPLAGLLTRSIPDLQPAFESFLGALKARAERG